MVYTRSQRLLIWLTLAIIVYQGSSQQYPTNPSVWLFPEGNPQATRYQPIPSLEQDIKNFIVKWRNKSIAGNVQILVGNVIPDTNKIDDTFPYAPNEIIAAIGGKLVVIDGKGFTHKVNTYGIQFVKNVSFLFDTLSTSFYPNPTSTLVAGLETIEFENPKDTLIYTYIAGYDKNSDTIALLKRLVLDMREYKPNLYGSMKPFFARKFGNDFLVYVATNIFKPQVSESNPTKPPFYRGISLFPSNYVLYTFPMPDITDNFYFRVTLGPEIHSSQPSLFQEGGNFYATLPNQSSLELDVNIPCIITLEKTNPQKSYLLAYTFTSNQIRHKFQPMELNSILDDKGKRPRIRPIFVTLNNSSTRDSLYIVVAEEYFGTDSSFGQSQLHLFDGNGNAITLPNDLFAPSFKGKANHIWSLSVGDLDGISTNSFNPYYPNNPGKEIVATYSSKFSNVAGNKLLVLRYNMANPIPKPNPPNSYLFPFDTICTASVSGWVSAVNDLDGALDRKEEIVLVDGSRLLVLKMRNYDSFEFKMGKPFDTLLVKEFPKETIMDAIIADVEGDGRNDIIVLTNNATYLIGSPLPKLIEVVEPIYDEAIVKEYCYGDTLNLTLKAKTKSEHTINIRFLPSNNGSYDYKNSIVLLNNLKIDKEISLVKIPVTREITGKSGILYIDNAIDATQVFDSSGIFQFNPPLFVIDTSVINQIDFYKSATIQFYSKCIDTVALQLSDKANQWNNVLQVIKPKSTEIHTISLPCAADFDYFARIVKWEYPIRAIYSKSDYKELSEIFLKQVKPETFPIVVDSTQSLCCTKFFKWNISCDTVSVLISLDNGDTFIKIAEVPAKDVGYIFEPQRNFPDYIHFRFVCAKECYIADTVFYTRKPSIINAVVPNPFNPYLEQAEISFIMQKDATVTIKIIDQANGLVKKLLESSFRNKDTYYCIYWDGRTEESKIASPGLYYIIIETPDGIQEIFPIFVK